MVERISTATRYAQLIADMKINQFNFNKLTAQLSSGKKLTSITDDPIASVNYVNTSRQLGRIETYEQNVNMATSELSALDDFMELARGYLQTAWDKAVQANNQTYNGNSLRAMKTEIDEITKTMVDLANAEYDDNYIFAGANTKLIPYEIDENGYINYYGTPSDNSDYVRQTEVADGVFEVINTTGDKVFGYYMQEDVTRDTDGKIVTLDKDDNKYYYEDGTEYTGDIADLTTTKEDKAEGVMGALKLLSQSIQMVLDGDTENGYKQMNATLDMFSNAHNDILNQQTKFGGVYNRMEMSASTLETTGENLTSYITDLNSVDYATAITQWMNAQYAYQASLQVAAGSMNMSLLNYIQ
ncbi:MAG: flagellar hook-associated protein FlgL [bacterium]|nr:flagellar hook-associated protein FlgL [bacterium]